MLVEPISLEDQPVSKECIGANDYVMKVHDHVVGRVVARRVTGGRVVWMWMLTGIHLPIQLQPSHGAAKTEADAEAAFRSKFDAWLSWAKARGTPVEMA